MTDLERAEMQKRIIGPVVPLNIPYGEDESIDYGALERHVDFLAASGVPTLLLTYGSSEYAHLSDQEIEAVTKAAAGANAGRSVFVGATKGWSVQKSIQYVGFAKECGAHSVKIQPPYFGGVEVNQDHLLTYYRKIGEATDLPLWGYSMPVAGKHGGMSPETWRRITAECANVYAMKTDGDMIYGLYDLAQASGEKAMVVSGGQMKTMLFGWPLGSRAYLCGIAPFMPGVSLYFTECMKKGDTAEAMRVIHAFEDPLLGMCLKANIDWLALIKAVLYAEGFFPTPLVRCPGNSATDFQIREVRALCGALLTALQGFDGIAQIGRGGRT